jgi:hypothetical protein
MDHPRPANSAGERLKLSNPCDPVLAGVPLLARSPSWPGCYRSRRGRICAWGSRFRRSLRMTACCAFLRQQSEPVGADAIRNHLGLSQNLSNRLQVLTDEGTITKTGERRDTRYSI